MIASYRQPDQPLNLVLVGSGHYSTGQTTLSGQATTDKDFGVFLPSALYLRANGWVDKIAVCGRNGNKFHAIRNKINIWGSEPGIDVSFDAYPSADVDDDDKAYLEALDRMPRPSAALIAVPDEMHTEVMIACAERDIPFFIVKPAVTRLDDFYKVRLAMNKDLIGMVDYHKVFDEANLLLLADISRGCYGKIHHVSTLMSQRRDMINIYERWLRVNPFFNVNHYLGSHYIHMTGFLTGAIPLDVRATQQYGFIKKEYSIDVADTIQTQIRWKGIDNDTFVSYHIAGWADPSETEAMTFQQIHLLTESGHIFSDQRDRGTRKVLQGGVQIVNPYFFNFSPCLLGGWNLGTKYGFESVFVFVRSVLAGRPLSKDLRLPTFAESERVTAILEAADLSLENDSCTVTIQRRDDRLYISAG